MLDRGVRVFAMLGLGVSLCLGFSGCGGASKITRANADKVTTGMTEQQVANLLGSPTSSADIQIPNLGGLPGVELVGDGQPVSARLSTWNEGSKVITVTFVNGKVVARTFDDGGDASLTGKKYSSPPGDTNKPGPLDQPPFVQKGSFTAIAKEEGMVNFPIPYALPPNVELLEYANMSGVKALVKDVTATGFKWKGVGKQDNTSCTVDWTAKGIKATKLPDSK